MLAQRQFYAGTACDAMITAMRLKLCVDPVPRCIFVTTGSDTRTCSAPTTCRPSSRSPHSMRGIAIAPQTV